MKFEDTKLSTFDRVTRTAFGFALIGAAYFGTGALGYLALLPIVAIVPLMTATLGVCPVEGKIRSEWRKAHRNVVRTHGHSAV